MTVLNLPPWAERTDPDDRNSGQQFEVSYQRTQKELRQEFERMGVDEWRIEDVTGSDGNPTVIVRWERHGGEYAAVCDAYERKAANLRSIYLWVNETRMREQRPVQTAQDSFAAAALPSGNEDAIELPDDVTPAHEMLGVAKDAPEAVVRGAFRELVKQAHSDGGKDVEHSVEELKDARDVMLK